MHTQVEQTVKILTLLHCTKYQVSLLLIKVDPGHGLGLLVVSHVLHYVGGSHQLLSVLIRDLKPKLILNCLNNLHMVQAVQPQVIDVAADLVSTDLVKSLADSQQLVQSGSVK